MSKKERLEIERKMCEKLQELYKLYKDYNPQGDYLHIVFLEGDLSFNNDYSDSDVNIPVYAGTTNGEFWSDANYLYPLTKEDIYD